MPYIEDPGGLDGPSWKVGLPGPATVTDRVIAFLSKMGGYADGVLTPDTSFVLDLGADSLDKFELLMLIEDEFGVEIPGRDAESIRTIGQLSDDIESRLRSRKIQGIGP